MNTTTATKKFALATLAAPVLAALAIAWPSAVTQTAAWLSLFTANCGCSHNLDRYSPSVANKPAGAEAFGEQLTSETVSMGIAAIARTLTTGK